MAPPISVEVRKRVVVAYREGKGTYAELADVFQVGEASVSRWLRRERETGSLEPKPPPGRAPKLDEHGRSVLRELVETDNDATLAELASRLHARTGVTLVVSAVHKVLVKMGISRKKKTSMRASATATTSGS
jgi:transposase